jgi:DNA-directed RNA polymerase specialized sigma24 family protein
MEEISDILGIPVGTVKTRIYLCRRSIMSEMSVD